MVSKGSRCLKMRREANGGEENTLWEIEEMTLSLIHSKDQLDVKTGHPSIYGFNVHLSGEKFSIELTMDDFCQMVYYVMINTDLKGVHGRDDARAVLKEKISNLVLAPGYQPDHAHRFVDPDVVDAIEQIRRDRERKKVNEKRKAGRGIRK